MSSSGSLKVANEATLAGLETANVRILRISGFVKWFDVGRGYGFVIPDNGLPDVLLHLSCLKRDGFAAPARGHAGRLRCGRAPEGLSVPQGL